MKRPITVAEEERCGKCARMVRRRNTYVLFNLERSHDSIFIQNRNSRMGVSSLTGYGNPWTHLVVLRR
jgi:hypothetical protein